MLKDYHLFEIYHYNKKHKKKSKLQTLIIFHITKRNTHFSDKRSIEMYLDMFLSNYIYRKEIGKLEEVNNIYLWFDKY